MMISCQDVLSFDEFPSLLYDLGWYVPPGEMHHVWSDVVGGGDTSVSLDFADFSRWWCRAEQVSPLQVSMS